MQFLVLLPTQAEMRQQKNSRQIDDCQLSGPTWARTKDLLIMSQLL